MQSTAFYVWDISMGHKVRSKQECRESWEWGLMGPHIGKAAKAGWTLAETSERVLEFHGVSRGSDTGALCKHKPDL